jgi:sirohydrochlorin cobaltochelatase
MRLRNLDALMAELLGEGYRQLGEVAILPAAEIKPPLGEDGNPYPAGGEGFYLCHYRDGEGLLRGEHVIFERALEIYRYDDRGDFRPLRTAPTLRQGWLMVLLDVSDVRQALDFFYPAALGMFGGLRSDNLPSVNVLDTMRRQTGMYQVVRAMTPEQADELTGGSCLSHGGCMRTILWKIDKDLPAKRLPPEKFDPEAVQMPTTLKTIPVFCCEICNLLVAQGRRLMKGKLQGP